MPGELAGQLLRMPLIVGIQEGNPFRRCERCSRIPRRCHPLVPAKVEPAKPRCLKPLPCRAVTLVRSVINNNEFSWFGRLRQNRFDRPREEFRPVENGNNHGNCHHHDNLKLFGLKETE